MFCANCGAKVADGQRFCANCGATVGSFTPEEIVSPAPAEEVPYVPAFDPAGEAPADPVPPKKSRKQKKSHRLPGFLRVIIGIVIALAIIGILGCAAVAIFVPGAAQNFIYKTFRKPEVYYQWLETRTLNQAIDASRNAQSGTFGDIAAGNSFAVQSDLTVSLNNKNIPSEISSMIQSSLGFDIDWIKSVGVNSSFARDGSLLGVYAMAQLNGKDVADMDVIVDPDSGQIYAKIPLFSDQYFLYEGTAGDLSSANSLQLDPEVLTGLLERYSAIAIRDISNVKKSAKTVTAGGVSARYTVLEVKLDGKTILKIAGDVLEEAQNDKDVETFIRAVLTAQGYSGEYLERYVSETVNSIPTALEQIDEMKSSQVPFDINMVLYVDSLGNICGREVKVRSGSDKEDSTTVSYLMTYNLLKLKFGLHAESLSDNSYGSYSNKDNYILDGSGKIKLFARNANGSFDLRYKSEYRGNKEDIKVGKLTLNASLNKKGAVEYELNFAPGKDALEEVTYGMPKAVSTLVSNLNLTLKGTAGGGSDVSYDVILYNGKKDLITVSNTIREISPRGLRVPSGALSSYEYGSRVDFDAAGRTLIQRLSDAGVPANLLNYLQYALY